MDILEQPSLQNLPSQTEWLPTDKDYLVWVGRNQYRNFTAFLTETTHKGVCRAIPYFDRKMKIGKTRIFLAYPFARVRPKFTGGVFGYFTISYIIQVLPDYAPVCEWYRDFGVTGMPYSKAREEATRGGVRKKLGALYLGCPKGIQKWDKDSNYKKGLILLPAVIPIQMHFFQGVKKLGRDLILPQEFPSLDLILEEINKNN